MSLKIDIDDWDYKGAVEAIEKLLNNIKIKCDDIENMPSAEEIVDTVWDNIK